MNSALLEQIRALDEITERFRERFEREQKNLSESP